MGAVWGMASPLRIPHAPDMSAVALTACFHLAWVSAERMRLIWLSSVHDLVGFVKTIKMFEIGKVVLGN